MPSVNVLTNRYDNSRKGANLQEARLNVDNVRVPTFGKLFGRSVDGDLYAQPLIVSGLAMSGRPRNVVYLATSRNWVYAYDADDPDEVLPLWQRNLGLPVPRDEIFKAMNLPDRHYLNFGSEIGITSTPVVDLQQGGGAGTLYIVAKSRSGPHTQRLYTYRLHALDILTGHDTAIPNNPVTITAKATKATGKTITFDPVSHLNRPGLLLHNGVLYLAFGSHGDEGVFYGWVMAYDAMTLAQLAVYCTAPDWGEGGIWQSGCGLAGDSEGFIYVVVGNGEKPSTNARKNPPVPAPLQITAPVYGNCILKLKLAQNPQGTYALKICDWFTATDCMDLNEIDQDLVAGPVLFEIGSVGSRKKLVLGCGKDGRFYLLDRDKLGGFAPRNGGTPSHWDPKAGDSGRWIPWEGGARPQNALQDDKLCKYHIHGTPVLWQKSDADLSAYVWSEKDFLAAIRFRDGKFDATRRESMSQYGLPEDELRMPGGILTLSANADQDGTGIVWASHPTDDDAMNKTVKGTLRAYDARDLDVELWNSDQDASGADRVGLFAKFCPPVVANGKVYLATFSRELAVYGLLADLGRERGNEAGIFEQRPFGPNVSSGMCAFSCSRYDLTGGGEGLSGREDSFFFAFRTIDSDEQPRISITARLVGLSNSTHPQNRAARAGIMIRKFGEPQDVPSLRYATLVITADNQALFQRRARDASDSAQDGPVPAVPPFWLRLSCEQINKGSFSFVGELSADGTVWNRLSTATVIPMDGRLMVGLVITAQTPAGTSATPEHPHAAFADVEVTPVI